VTIDPGLLLVDKEAGVTSHATVSEARRRLGIRRIGHTGTLDPFATGLLLLCVGTFTRAAAVFHALPKRYVATMRLGEETDTADPEGTVQRTDDSWRRLTRDDIASAIAGRVGASMQVPPAFSAKQVGGVRAYAAARAGRSLELAAAPIVVHEAALLDVRGAEADLRVTVSTGTYVRALARDIGHDLGCGAHLTALRRTRIGPLRVEDGCVVSTLGRGETPGCWRSPVDALSWLRRRELDEAEAEAVAQGRAIETGTLSFPEGPEHAQDGGEDGTDAGRVALVHVGRLAALGESDGARILPRTVFPA